MKASSYTIEKKVQLVNTQVLCAVEELRHSENNLQTEFSPADAAGYYS